VKGSLMNWRKAIRSVDSMVPELNQYLLTFRDEHGKRFQYEAKALSMRLAVEENHHPLELLKVERIDPETGTVLGGLYNE
jgi:hypothetical protein